jgi:hypothetical protein
MMMGRVLREPGGSGYIFISEVGGPTFAPAGNFRMGRSCEATSRTPIWLNEVNII